MMAEEPVGIENPSKLDLVSTSPDESTVLLHIVQAQEWDGSTRLLPPLHEKCKNYVAFACDGQLARMYPEYALLPWQIVVDCQSEPDERTQELLRRADEATKKEGGRVVLHRLWERN